MADLPSTFSKVNDVEVAQDAPVTEALFAKIGSDVNYLKDNLDAEITNRAAADTAITTDITNNVKGAGPFQTLTQLKSRVDNAKNITLPYDQVTTEAATPLPDRLLNVYVLDAPDGDSYRIRRQDISTGSLTTVLDSGISVSDSRWAEMSLGTNGVNNFLRLKVFEFSGV